MLNQQDSLEIKSKLINHIQKTFPEDKKDLAISQIKEMTALELEDFLEKNKIFQTEGPENCVFCSIVSDKIPSYKIFEDKELLGVLEINPISKGHVLIIPKSHGKITIPNSEFIEKLKDNIKEKFNPKEILISNSELFGHEIINIIPIYTNETANSQREHLNEKEFKEIQEQLTKQVTLQDKIEKQAPPKEILGETQKKEPTQNLWIPKRIP